MAAPRFVPMLALALAACGSVSSSTPANSTIDTATSLVGTTTQPPDDTTWTTPTTLDSLPTTTPPTVPTSTSVALRPNDPVGQLVGSSYVRVLPMTSIEVLGPFSLPSGSVYVGGVALSDMHYGIDQFEFAPGQTVLLLGRLGTDPQVLPHQVEVVAGIELHLGTGEQLTFLDCTLDGAPNRDVFAVVQQTDELSQQPDVTLRALLAWRADIERGAIDAIDASKVTCVVPGAV